VAELKVLWRALGTDGEPLVAIEEDPVPSFAAPLRQGDVVSVSVSTFPDGKTLAPARVVGTVTKVRFADPDELGPETPREVTLAWQAPRPDGVDLRVRQLSDDTGPPLPYGTTVARRLRYEITQAGPAVVRGLKLLSRHVDPDARVAPQTDTDYPVFGPGGPSLQPGERRVFSTYTSVDPGLTEVSLEVVDIDAVPATTP
jgi:hypothetical protein